MTIFRIPLFLSAVWRRRVWRINDVNGAIYLTFDDGPIPEVTPWVLNQLLEKDIKATFFCVGENVKKHPEIFQRIISEGHSVGNHSMHHEKGINTETDKYVTSVINASQYIQSDLFRPPYGRMTIPQSRSLRKRFRIIMWSWLTYDFDPLVPVDYILEKARKEIRSGDVIVLHDNVKSFDRIQMILPELITILQQKGLKFLPIKN